MSQVQPMLSPEIKAMIAAVAAYMVARKAYCENILAPYITQAESGAISFANKEVAAIPNPFLKMAAECVVSTYGPELPAFVSEYEGTVYDKFVAFLKAISA